MPLTELLSEPELAPGKRAVFSSLSGEISYTVFLTRFDISGTQKTMIPLIISILMLAMAPLIYQLTLKFQNIWKYTNRLLILLVTSVVVLHLLPESIRVIGFRASGLALIGLFLPSFLERLWSSEAKLIHRFTLLFAVAGLALHGMMDGAALTSPHPGFQGSTMLQWAVLLHRLPAAILIWSIFYPGKGKSFALGILTILGVFTVLGFSVGQAFLQATAPSGGMYYFQALVAGSLLHIAFDQHDDGHQHHHHHSEETHGIHVHAP